MLEETTAGAASPTEAEPDIREIVTRLERLEKLVAALTGSEEMPARTEPELKDERQAALPDREVVGPESEEEASPEPHNGTLPGEPGREDEPEQTSETHLEDDRAREAEGANSSPSIEAWFLEHGLTATLAEEEPGDRVYVRLAEYLGDHLDDLDRFLRGLKWTAHEGQKSSLSFRNSSDAERRHTVEFAKMLHDLALLSYHHYNERGDRLSFMASERAEFLRFIRGAWLEQYVLAKVHSIVRASGKPFAIARGIQVERKSPKHRFEMDVFALLEEIPLWIECKSGDYRADIEKYVGRAAEIGIPLDHTFLVVAGVDDDVAHDLSDLFGLAVTPASSLGAEIKRAIGAREDVRDLGLEARLAKLFADFQMTPHPEVRGEILSRLAATEEALPISVAEIREQVRGEVPENQEKAVHPVLTALRRGGGLLGESGKPVGGLRLDSTVHGLASTDPAALEALCQSAYQAAVEKKMPEARTQADFDQAFGQLVNG